MKLTIADKLRALAAELLVQADALDHLSTVAGSPKATAVHAVVRRASTRKRK